MLVTEDHAASADRQAGTDVVSQVETRFSIARDALINEKSHMDEAIRQFLDAQLQAWAKFRITRPDPAPLDVVVIDAIQRMKPMRDFFLEIVSVINRSDRAPEVHKEIRRFLGQLLAHKHAPRDVIHFNHLWCDHYRFLVREVFLSVIGLLIRDRHYDEVNRYLEADYVFQTNGGPRQHNYLKFDGYIKSLDEFRPRRLRLERLSVSADLLKERADLSFLGFDDVMQADFVLCLRGLLHHTDALVGWFPRTLVYAERYQKPGFDLFFSAQAKDKFPAIGTVLQVRDKQDLLDRFERVSRECALEQWKFGNVAIPFAGYMALAGLDSV